MTEYYGTIHQNIYKGIEDCHSNPFDLTNLERFRFSAEAPLGWWGWPVGIVLGYFLFNRLFSGFMSRRAAPDDRYIKPALAFHNLAISLASLVLGGYLSVLLIQRWLEGFNLHEMICSPEFHHSDTVQYLYWWNYIFKIWELVDTWFLILRKKPVIFLHEYHHAATLFLTWSQLQFHSGIQWVPIVLNLWVHVIMYFYYGMAATGTYFWWKKYLTRIQITQFVIDIVACLYAYIYGLAYSTGECWPFRPFCFWYEIDSLACYGTQTGAVIGIFLITSYFGLFIQFYRKTYLTPRIRKKSE